MSDNIYLNGNYISEVKALISYNDRGFQFADGVYEVIKYYKGKPFRLSEHLIRLTKSLSEVKIKFSQISTLEEIFNNLIESNSLKNKYAGVYIQITRGSYPRLHSFPENIEPTVCANTFLFNARKDNLLNGIRVITQLDIRWLRCDIKSVSLLPNVLMMQEASEQGAQECILIRDGMITEGTRSNVIGVKNGKIITHPDSNLILSGITKGAVKDICRQHNIGFIEKPITERGLFDLDELMMVGTGNEISPVLAINDKKIGNGEPGPLTKFIQSHFFEMTYGVLAGDMWWQ